MVRGFFVFSSVLSCMCFFMYYVFFMYFLFLMFFNVHVLVLYLCAVDVQVLVL
jgi:hypothetical protein